MRVTVQADFRAVRKALRGLEKQAPYAISLALNNVAKETRAEVKEHLRDTMVVRRKWTGQGIGGKGGRPLTAGEKSTKKKLSVDVGSADPYMEAQAKAGTRKAGKGGRGSSGGKSLAVPTKGVRKTPATDVRKGKWPAALRLKPKHFFQEVKSGAVILFRRKGKTWVGKGKNRKRGPIIPLWVFVRRVRIGLAKKWQLGTQVREVVEMRWARLAREAINQAIATAKAK